jgi:hypothetical protein
VRLIAGTTTAKGLKVTCRLDRRKYPVGRKITDEELAHVNLKSDRFHGEWNYTIPSPQITPVVKLIDLGHLSRVRAAAKSVKRSDSEATGASPIKVTNSCSNRESLGNAATEESNSRRSRSNRIVSHNTRPAFRPHASVILAAA